MRTAGDTEAADNTVETIRQFEITYDGVAQAGATTMITLETTLATADEYLVRPSKSSPTTHLSPLALRLIPPPNRGLGPSRHPGGSSPGRS